MKRTPGKSWMLAYCGMASALCIAVMLLGTALPILLFIAPAVAGFLIATVREECGSRMALTAYASVSLLSLLLVPDREVALAFAALLGYYPLVKPRFDRIRPAIVQLLAKLCLCNLAVLAIYGLLLALLTGAPPMEQGALAAAEAALAVTTLVLGNVAFVLYDKALLNLLRIYRLIWQPRLHRMLGHR